jgi:hypothetical protein
LRYLALAAITAAIILFGLLYTLDKGIEVAPHAAEGADGRFHYHTKNVTRFLGSADEVYRDVQRAVELETSGASLPADWRALVRQSIRIAEPVRHVVVLPAADDAAPWALPGAYWAVYGQVPVVFVGRDRIDAAELDRLRGYAVPIYLLAPREIVSDQVLEQLRAVAPAMRVAGKGLAGHAVRIAEYRDWETGFGWGREAEQHDGYFEFALAAPGDAMHAFAALPLARSNAATFLFADDEGGLPGETDRFLWSQRARFFVTPSEGPFRHLWIIGNRMSYAAQGRVDLAVEKAPYPSAGPVALGPMEALFLAYISLGLAGGVLVGAHARRHLPGVMPAMRIAWFFTATLLPVAGPLLYFAAYRRPMRTSGHMAIFERPPAIEAAAATAMGFGYGAPLMIAIGYLFVFFGFPLFYGQWASGWWFLLGAGMPLMMLGMYLGTILIAWLVVQWPMKGMWTGRSPRQSLLPALGTTALSMSAVSLGMMTTAWWMMMEKLPMMPKEDELLWFGALWLASGVGFLVAWPLNWIMVRLQLKPGAT